MVKENMLRFVLGVTGSHALLYIPVTCTVYNDPCTDGYNPAFNRESIYAGQSTAIEKRDRPHVTIVLSTVLLWGPLFYPAPARDGIHKPQICDPVRRGYRRHRQRFSLPATTKCPSRQARELRRLTCVPGGALRPLRPRCPPSLPPPPPPAGPRAFLTFLPRKGRGIRCSLWHRPGWWVCKTKRRRERGDRRGRDK